MIENTGRASTKKEKTGPQGTDIFVYTINFRNVVPFFLHSFVLYLVSK